MAAGVWASGGVDGAGRLGGVWWLVGGLCVASIEFGFGTETEIEPETDTETDAQTDTQTQTDTAARWPAGAAARWPAGALCL